MQQTDIIDLGLGCNKLSTAELTLLILGVLVIGAILGKVVSLLIRRLTNVGVQWHAISDWVNKKTIFPVLLA